MTDYRTYATEYDDSHDKIDDEHELLKSMFDRLRADVRKEYSDKKDAAAALAEFKALLVARRKFGPTLDGYADKSERIQNLNDEIFGRSTSTLSNKRATANPRPNAGPSKQALARAGENDETRASVSGAGAEPAEPTCAIPGSAPPNSISFEAAASETAARSPELNKGEGRKANATLQSAPSGGTGMSAGTAAAAVVCDDEGIPAFLARV